MLDFPIFWDAAFLQYLKECCEAFEETPGFTSGLILVAISGVGRGCMFPVMDLGPKWTSHAASLNDWITLAGDSDCDALRLWRLGQHERLLEKHAIELLNPAGLLNLYAHWQNSDGVRDAGNIRSRHRSGHPLTPS